MAAASHLLGSDVVCQGPLSWDLRQEWGLDMEKNEYSKQRKKCESQKSTELWALRKW